MLHAFRKLSMVGIAAATLAGGATAVTVDSAQAQFFGPYGYGGYYRPHYRGYYRPYGFYRPRFYGYGYRGYGYRRFGYY